MFGKPGYFNRKWSIELYMVTGYGAECDHGVFGYRNGCRNHHLYGDGHHFGL